MYESKKSKEPEDNKIAQRKGTALQKKANNTGLPDSLKEGVENLSGYSMDDVKVHYNSSKPAQLNAHAYAQGSEIHLASGQEKHLPHEAWHVVQQKQGRVKPTTQVGGVDVNDNAQLEKEADVMGAKAIQMKGKFDSDQDSKMAANNSKVVQRAVGYEFETGWLVGIELSLGNVTPLKKKDRIGFTHFDGFKMEADEAGADLSEIEFIVDPPVPEGKGGINRLDTIMSDMETFGQVLEAKAADGNPFTLNEVTGNIRDKLFVITPTRNGKLSAGPQVTTGLDLAKIPRLESINNPLSRLPDIFKDSDESAVPEELRGSIGQLEDGASEITSKRGDLSPQLTGLLTLITNYLSVGGYKYKGQDLDDNDRHAVALNYPKRIGDVLLARTNFAKLLSLIPQEELFRFLDHHDQWLDLVMSLLPDYIDVNDSVIQRGIQNDESDVAQGVHIPNLTIRDWLLGMLQGQDRLTQIEDAESMGEFGAKTEKVGGTSKSMFAAPEVDAGIFEFRGAQTQKIALPRWKPFALEFLKYISAVHNEP